MDQNSELWLGGAFSAYGLAGAMSRFKKNHKISLMTSSDSKEYVKEFRERAGLGRVELYKGRWQWICDDPDEVQRFYAAVGKNMIGEKREMIEVSWSTWRARMIDATDGEVDPGAIDGEPTTKQ